MSKLERFRLPSLLHLLQRRGPGGTGLDARVMPGICTDKPGFDRTAFHAELNAALVTFFRKQLALP